LHTQARGCQDPTCEAIVVGHVAQATLLVLTTVDRVDDAGAGGLLLSAAVVKGGSRTQEQLTAARETAGAAGAAGAGAGCQRDARAW
jgi:hypothetical protein